jgi:hypothetical protein
MYNSISGVFFAHSPGLALYFRAMATVALGIVVTS